MNSLRTGKVFLNFIPFLVVFAESHVEPKLSSLSNRHVP